MKKAIYSVTIICFYVLLTACGTKKNIGETEIKINNMNNNVETTPISEEVVNNLPLLKFDINDIEFIVDGFSELEFQTEKQTLSTQVEMVYYAYELMNEYFSFINEFNTVEKSMLLDMKEYVPIAILEDELNGAWAVSFQKNDLKSDEIIIGDAYNIAFYEKDGSVIAIYKDE